MNTQERFKIRDTLNCESHNIIYLLSCDKFYKSQYLGQTKLSMRLRFDQHRSDIRHHSRKESLETKHFNSFGHTLNNMKCLVIEK